MKYYRLTPAAEDDLFDIWAYIAADNPEAADALERDLLAACQRLADWPELPGGA